MKSMQGAYPPPSTFALRNCEATHAERGVTSPRYVRHTRHVFATDSMMSEVSTEYRVFLPALFCAVLEPR